MSAKRKYAICFDSKKNYNAGSKATEDINIILNENNYEYIYIPLFNTKMKIFNKIMNLIKYAVLFRVKKNSVVFIQHPQYVRGIYMDFLYWMKKLKKCQYIFLIHDIESLRKAFPEREDEFRILDQKMYEISDVIIAHNDSMIEYLTRNCGIAKDKIVNLCLFDYLVDNVEDKSEYDSNTIAVAGNLSEKKAGYVYKVADMLDTLKVRAYGANYNEVLQKNGALIYEGAVKPDELPRKLKGAWGLVWDGAEVDCCEGNIGNYLRYNNPHKVSLFVAAELPIIIWEKAALASFVKKNNIGITINSLKEIEDKVNKISNEEYMLMKRNINEIGGKVKRGMFSEMAIEKAEQKLQEIAN